MRIVSVPAVDVVQPVQQRVDVCDFQLVVSDGLQATGDRLVVAFRIHLEQVKGQNEESPTKPFIVSIVFEGT